MKIRKINISGFGKFENRIFTLNPGMNIFYGCNESGKSTLQSFIKGMFYGLKGGKRTKDGILPPVKQYKPWTAKAYGGSLEYELDDGSSYTIVRNFDKNTVTVYDKYSNNITGNFPAGREEGVKFAEQHMGLSESCFERTVFIGQMQSTINSEGKKIIAERLTNIKHTGDEEVSFRKAIETLKEAQMTYVGSERTTTRPLNIINSRLQEAIEEEQEYIRLHESCMDMFLELERLRKREAELRNRLDELSLLRKKLDKKIETEKLENIYGTLGKCLERINVIENEIAGKKQELDETLVRLKEFEVFKDYSRKDYEEMVSDYTNYVLLRRDLENCEAEWRENEDRIKEIRNEIERYGIFSEDALPKMDEAIQNVLLFERESVNPEKDEMHPSALKKYVSFAALTAGIIILLLSFLIKPYSPIATAAGLLISAAAGALMIIAAKQVNVSNGEYSPESIGKKKYMENSKLLNSWMEQVNVKNIHDFIRLKNMIEAKIAKLHELSEKRQKITERKNDILSRIEEFETRIQTRLSQTGLVKDENFTEEDIRKWREGFEICGTLTQTVKDLETVLNSLNQERESICREVQVISGTRIGVIADLEEEIKNISARLENAKAELGDWVPLPDNLTRDDLELKIKLLGDELAQVSLQINTLSTRLENIPDGEMIQMAHEKVRLLTWERDRKLFLGKALEIAMEVLTEASVDIQRNYSPYLNESMGEILDKITGGRYKEVMADDSLKLNIQPPGVAEKVVPEQLSSGTADQVYFALRLATVRLMEKDGETLPLFLDDPFVQYDEERTKNAFKLLCEESGRRQIILFTCRKRELELAREVFGDKGINIVNL
ncbi:SMC domain-containing protein [Thermoclostridium stercorarium subsp. stercorarium DSM 8532]|jgi:DNA repair exonuclease SbcCD ATPase subunit|uniref:SMC domain-containing protein n=2 Tax=Thermoclostridium stercorarium TaxID=1510 RepID=L7VV13_THES1|nr:AAA family ATPase [Thermoclostridium stercorarium]AGC69428.1 SMC domain-containing protein [Thermoclostridium stercorarium subsp. stercorarium DSM 8532]AGI40385.1 AAA domain-containing protein [Thermoclostridium stercorarium subsp. stercorarium DSM 8532]ANW99675.1 chromosome segregation protein SMC [Thermoclostridium stercorarium subsp. thermolacticum DSM 2910]